MKNAFSDKNSSTPIAQTFNVPDKLQNDLFPLLNGSEDDIDELDDEVAMISNKKGPSEN